MKVDLTGLWQLYLYEEIEILYPYPDAVTAEVPPYWGYPLTPGFWGTTDLVECRERLERMRRAVEKEPGLGFLESGEILAAWYRI
jgi:hypothetical protein